MVRPISGEMPGWSPLRHEFTLNDQEAFAIDAEDDYRYCAPSEFVTVPTNTNQPNMHKLSDAGSSIKVETIPRLHAPGIVLGSISGSPSASPSCGKETFNQYRPAMSPSWNVGSYGFGRYSGFDTGHLNYGSEGLGAGH